MNILELQNGGNAFWVKIEMLIDKGRFAQALCEHFYRTSEPFELTSKRAAMKILKDELKFHGRMGEYDSESLGVDNIDEYNSIYDTALTWVVKKYPKL